MSMKNVLSVFSLRFLWLALGAISSGSVLAEPAGVDAEVISAESDRAEREAELQAEFKGKTLPQIRALLDEDIDKLEKFQRLNSVRLSLDSGDKLAVQHTPSFNPLPPSVMASEFNRYFDSLKFQQHIVAKTSDVFTTFDPWAFLELAPDYNAYGYRPATLKIERVHFKDGTSAIPAATEEKEVYNVDSAQRVVSMDVSAYYTLPGQVKRLDFSDTNNREQDGITLVSINGQQVTLTMPAEMGENILLVEAVDQQGKALKNAGSSSFNDNSYYLDKLHNHFTATVKQIDNKAIRDKAGLIKYLLDNTPSQREIEKQHPPQYFSSYRFSGYPTAVTVFLKSEAEEKIHTFTLKTPSAESEYVNGVTIGSDIPKKGLKEFMTGSNEPTTGLKGLIDEQGNWLIAPQYASLRHVSGSYYNVVTRYNDNGVTYMTTHFFNKTTKTLEPRPFDIVGGKIHQDKFVLIKSDSNSKEGVLNIQSEQVVLPIEYDVIDVQAPFFIAYKRINGAKSYDVYRQNDNKMVLSGEFRTLIVDGDNIITESTASSTGNTDSGVNVYSASGVKLNAEPYSKLPLDASFGNDGLIPVTDKQNKFYYIDRKAKKTKFNLSDYQHIMPFSNGLAAVQGKNNQYGYINTQGKLVIPLMYKEAHYFQGGTALVSVGDNYRLITPDNKVATEVATELGEHYLYSYTMKKDSQEARYTFEIHQSGRIIPTYTEYNHKGERGSDKD